MFNRQKATSGTMMPWRNVRYFPAPLLQKNVAVGEARPANWGASVGIFWRPLIYCLCSYRVEFSSMPSVLPLKGPKAPLCVVWQCASFVQQASRRPDDELPSNEWTAWFRTTQSGMITRHGTGRISSMPDFLQMHLVDTKKQLKLITTSGLMTNKKGGGYTGAKRSGDVSCA